MQYQCTYCKKIIGKTNPKAPSNSQQVNLIQTNHKKFGFYFPYPVGHCRDCGEPYDIKPDQLIDEKILDPKQKKALAEQIAKAQKDIDSKNKARIKDDEKKNTAEKKLAEGLAKQRKEQEIEDAKNEEIEANKKQAKLDFEREKLRPKTLAEEAEVEEEEIDEKEEENQ